MIRIGITLDDVIRAKTYQIGKIYKKHIDKDIDLNNLDLSTDNFAKVFNFKSNTDYIKYLYEDYAFEIFGEAGVMDKMLDKDLNLWHLNLNNDDEIDEQIELVLMNPREFNNSIGFTYFFLSKIATRVREIYLPEDFMSIWDKCDVLISADNKLLKNKPEDKLAVKIETTYNGNAPSDYTYNSLMSLIKDEGFIKKIVNKLKENN